ncbi:hypothetical protein [Pseudomonas chlororaphis]|uniref:hypothetical protein n=1 Tax=Pseudomonas chlororaphis TaxID=587753 RepID=UPI000F5501F5|nr:hypothetical protein [Pseudomonas chlororaphis]
MQMAEKVALSENWQSLIKAAVLDQIFVQGNKANHVLLGVARPLRVVATCAGDAEPWELTADHIALAREVATEIQASGKLAILVDQVTRNIIDHFHLADRCPLQPVSARRKISRATSSEKRADPRQDLAQRKDVKKLPESRAFWELVRIVFTVQPKSFLDELRFAQVKLLILCGLRIGEVCMMPMDWRRQREYVDASGRPAGNSGGISESLMLRYFAEKRSLEDHDGTLLYPEAQHIPAIFEAPLQEALDRVARLTAPLRKRLKAQVTTGRLLPEFEPDQLVAVVELYPYLSGNPFIYPDPLEAELTAKYKQSFDIKVLQEVHARQLVLSQQGIEIRNEVRIYFAKIRRGREQDLPFRTKSGHPLLRSDYRDGYFRIDELEALIRSVMPTKLSDTEGFRSTAGDIQSYELLLLGPKRSLGEERNGGICDVLRYCFVGRITAADLMMNLGDRPGMERSIFARYGETEEDQQLSVDTHAFRHLQNTELFRLGIADTIITKRFGRKSVAQSYEYDHRSLAEELAAIDLPEVAETALGPKAQQVFRMIAAGKVKGPLVEEFLRIQREQGDDTAFAFLAAEADGFHTTPYGFCVNSFTVDPCPKHLECYNGCRHLSTTELPAHRINLERLQEQLKTAVVTIEARPSQSIGRSNQLMHAKTRLDNLQKALDSLPGTKPFENGADLSQPISPIQRSLFDD